MLPTTTRSFTPAILSIAALSAVACSPAEKQADRAGMLPTEIHGLQLAESHSGEEATGIIGEMHRGEVESAESHIGFYGPEEMRAMLYVSRYASDEEALSQLAAMASSISTGVPGYGHHKQFDVDGREVHSVFGGGQVHYFFVREAGLWWLASPPQLARPALAELLEIEVESVPTLMPPTGG